MEERVDSFLQLLDSDQVNTSSLMIDFTDYYFHYNNTEISKSIWDRLFEGGAKSQGIFHHLK